VDRYEELRAIALGSLEVGLASRGLALLMHKGMATWMHTWSRLVIEQEPTVRLNSKNKPQQPALVHSGVITMLAEMTLSAAREVRV
jgi:hypothetical protein